MDIRPTGPCPARIMIVGEAPGEREANAGEPFIGPSGEELNRMLRDAGIMRSQCFVTNVVRVRPPSNDIGFFIATKKKDITGKHIMLREKFVLPVVRDGFELLKREIEMCQPTVIIAAGNVAMWALTGKWGITSWRGSVLQCDIPLALDYQPKVIPVYNPTSILRQWSWRQIAVQDLRRAEAEAKFRELIRPEYDFLIRPDYSTVITVLSQLLEQAGQRKGKLAVDIETRAGHIACLGIAWSKLAAICIPFMCVEKMDGYWPIEQESQIVHALYTLLTHPNVEVVGQNFNYDNQYIFRHWHFMLDVKRDTMLTQHSMFSALPKGLDFLSSMYCERHEYWKDEGKEWDPKKHDEDQYWKYNCKDAVITFEVDETEQTVIQQFTPSWKKLPAVVEFQNKLAGPVLRTMNKGIRVDAHRRSEFALELQAEMAKREQWLMDVLGQVLNPRSPLQMQNLFYGDFRQKPVLNRKTGNPSCDDEALRKICDREPLLLPLVNKILELRSLGVFFSTFIQAPLDIDGRLRSSFNIAGTVTYRFASSQNAFGTGLNFQNIPKGGELGDGLELPNVRSLFIPDPGHTFFDIDLSSADLRIVVWEADEPEYKAMLREGADPYTEIAKEFYHDSTITKKDPRRQIFKSFAHGTHYLGTAKGLAERLGLLVYEAESTQKWYFGRFPRIKKWQEDFKDQVYKRHMVENIFGYRLYILDRIEGTVVNEAIAWLPQSTVGCLINRAYAAIDSELPEVDVLLQVHDSLAGQYPTHLGDWAIGKIIEKSQIILPYDDPLIIPVGVKTSQISWGDCE